MRVGFLGPEGTYTEEAAKQVAGGAVLIPYPSIDAVFEAVASREVTRGVVPLESLIQGPVTETLDNLFQYAGRANIIDVLVLPIQHALGALTDKSQIRRILSKDQALKQCSLYLQQEFPQAQLVEMPSTTAAMEEIVRHQLTDAAAIGSEWALQAYGLRILDRNIGNVKHNKTRFAVLGDRYHPRTGNDATSLVIYPHRDRIGLLEEILSIISREYRLNMSSIHSRPDTKGGFRFYIELEGHLEDAAVSGCIQALQKNLVRDEIEVKVFGAYPRRIFNEPRIKTIGIIGGTGEMGQWFQRFFTTAGYTVLISGRRTPLTYQQCIEQSDVVIINVPIRHTVEVIQKVGKFFRPGQLITDNTSIKTQPVQAMLAAVPEGVEVLGMHTVFGPAVEDLRHQNVVFTYTPRSGELAQEFESIFYKYGARITRTTPEYHDQQMAFHQNLEHFTKVVLAELLRTRFGDPQVMTSYSSPNSRISLITMGRILSGDPDLYAEIQEYNLQGAGMIREYLQIAERIGRELMERNTEAFRTSMTQSATALGKEFLTEMLTWSKVIQRRLSEPLSE
ncbi:MAG: prephenate dehydrogenase/arogenate dehydrogenase family protein [Nitrospinota bacterium]|nr:MAG: prephenate dehydrogenase/arogenate dehydrogenase family protein [Nitrospinota bacterium]